MSRHAARLLPRSINNFHAFVSLARLTPVGLALVWLAASGLIAAAQNIQSPAQTADQMRRGVSRVEPTTLAVGFHLPLGTLPGRGGTSLPITAHYSSKVWQLRYQGFTPDIPGGRPGFQAYPQGLPNEIQYSSIRPEYDATAGWRLSIRPPRVEPVGDLYDVQGFPTDDSSISAQYVRRLRVVWADGGSAELRAGDAVAWASSPPTYPLTYVSVDRERLRYEALSEQRGVLYLPDGSQWRLDTGWNAVQVYRDRHGNQVRYTNQGSVVTDSLGRELGGMGPLSALRPPERLSPGVYTVNVPGFGGRWVTYRMRWRRLEEALREPSALRRLGDVEMFGPACYGCLGPSLFQSGGGARVISNAEIFNPVVLTEIELPTTPPTRYEFRYNVYGEVEQVVYPWGGYERFQYAPVAALDPLNEPYLQGNRGVTERRVSATGLPQDEQVWRYGVIGGGVGVNPVAWEEPPDGTRVERVIQCGRGPGLMRYGFNWARAGKVVEERWYGAAGWGGRPLLRRALTAYAVSGPEPGGHPTAERNARVTRTAEVVIEGGQALARTRTIAYDGDLNPVEECEYDYAPVDLWTAQHGGIEAFGFGSLLRRVTRTFLVNDPEISWAAREAYRARQMLGLPTRERVEDGFGQTAAETRLVYDESDLPPVTYGGGWQSGTWEAPGTWAVGNVTRTRRWVGHGQPWVEERAQADQFGNAVRRWDGRGALWETAYGASGQYAYPTQEWTPTPGTDASVGATQRLSVQRTYDLMSGLPVSETDANGWTTSYEYADGLDRLTRVNRPDGGWETWTYGDAPGQAFVRRRRALGNGQTETSEAWLDGLGRVTEERTYESGWSWIATRRQYDGLGRVWRTSAPYRLGETPVWETTSYDGLGRVTQVEQADGAAETLSYGIVGTRTSVTVTDAAGKGRRLESDGLGRLTRVVEDPAGLGYVTTYRYDAEGRLREVAQGEQRRWYGYDGLGRLIRARQPEQGVNWGLGWSDPVSGNSQWSVGYWYDANGNVTSRVDARGVATSYWYDGLNRVTRVAYSDGTPERRYGYDGAANGLGRGWWSATLGDDVTRTRREVTSYDAAGRVTEAVQRFGVSGGGWASYGLRRSWTVGGLATRDELPSGREQGYAYDAAGRLTATWGTLGDGVWRMYAEGITYTARGALAQEAFGTGTRLWHTRRYNIRGQVYDARVGTGSVYGTRESWDRGCIQWLYTDDMWGAGTSDPWNNGNIKRQQVWQPLGADGARLWMTGYEYDGLNRLTWAGEYHDTTEPEDGYVVYGVSYGYDRWGNRVCGGQGWRAGWADRASVGALARRGPDGRRGSEAGRPVGSDEPIRQGAPGCVAVGVDGATNRLVGSGIGYDANGNVTWDGVTGQGLRAYDGENRLVQAAGEGGGLWRYVYDADGRRVKLNVGRGDERWLVYGLDGAVVAEYAAQGAAWQPVTEYGYRNGELLVIGEGWRCRWVVSDVVGSVRLVVDQTGSAAGVKRRDYMPYGEDLGAGVGGRSAALGYEAAAPSDPRKKYGTYERDDGTGLDYAQARYYQSRLGRFTSVDGFAGGPEEVAVLGSGDGARQALPYGDLARPQSLNGYQYCYQNPLRYRDSEGHAPQDGPATLARERDTRDYLAGRITRQEYEARQRARAEAEAGGALLGLAGWGLVWALPRAPQAVLAWLGWAGRNPHIVEQVGQEALQAASGNPTPSPASSAAKGGVKLLPEVTRSGQLTQEGLEHIVSRHWATSGSKNTGLFAEGTTARSLRGMIDETLRNGAIRPNTRGRPGHIFEHDFGREIGTNAAEKPSSRLRVVRNPDGTIRTAFPY